MTVAEYAESWMRSRARSLKVATAVQYAHSLDEFIVPAIGDHYLDTLNPKVVRDWLTSLSARTNPRTGRPYAPESVNGHFRVLGTMLRDAAGDYELRDPTYRISIVKNHNRGKRKVRTLTGEELAGFLTAMRSLAPRHHPMATVAFPTGMRFSEYSALRWEDVDEQEGVILLWRSQVRGHVATTMSGEPRLIAMDDEGIIRDALRRQRRWLLGLQTRRRPESGYVRGFAAGWVFPSRSGGLSTPSLLDKPFEKVGEAIGLGRKITSHDCRRTFNTLARQAQVPDRVIQAIVGHHSEQMTERYDRVEVRERRQAVGQVIRFTGLAAEVGG